ncbi:hypothetical protein D3C80_2169790 [compost metagenome]
MQAFGRSNRLRRGNMVNLEAFLGVGQVEQREKFQFSNQLRGKGHRCSGLLLSWAGCCMRPVGGARVG